MMALDCDRCCADSSCGTCGCCRSSRSRAYTTNERSETVMFRLRWWSRVRVATESEHLELILLVTEDFSKGAAHQHAHCHFTEPIVMVMVKEAAITFRAVGIRRTEI
jgi:hypothetical protein